MGAQNGVHFDLAPLSFDDVPAPDTPDFSDFLDKHLSAAEKLVESMPHWDKHSQKVNGTVQIIQLKSSSATSEVRKELGIKEYWCGRTSLHTAQSVSEQTRPRPSHETSIGHLVRSVSHRLSRKPPAPHAPDGQANGAHGSAVEDDTQETAETTSQSGQSEVERQARVMSERPVGLYERFRRGLLEYHSENEREYIESCRETECLHVFQPHVAEVWRLTYVTPPPTNPRTFVVLLLSREIVSEPEGKREFMNVSFPFVHPDCPEKVGGEKSRVRGKYVSVERVRELDEGKTVEWKMATSSDAGGNIPRFITNGSLPNSISEDVPSFLKWMVGRFPDGGEVQSHQVNGHKA